MKSIVAFFLLFSLILGAEDVGEKLEVAYQAYLSGELATTAEERQVAFNQAAEYYDQLAQAYEDGQLYYNLANCYAQLGEPAWAILYYYKALKLCPRDDRIRANLLSAQERAGVPKVEFHSIWREVFFLPNQFSSDERHLMFAASFMLGVFFCSLSIWNSRMKVLGVAWAFFAVSALIALSLFYQSYLQPIQAIVVKTSPVRKDAGHHYAVVKEAILIPGSELIINEVVKDGFWVKIRLGNGVVGYVPYEAIQII